MNKLLQAIRDFCVPFGYLTAAGIIMTVLLLAFMGTFSGCSTAREWKATRSAKAIVAEQTPGSAMGAGGTVTGPANSATPTHQVAERRTAYFPTMTPAASAPAATPQAAEDITAVPIAGPPVAVPPQPITTAAPPPLQPAWTYEHVETTLGQHQDAAGIIEQAAKTATGWTKLQWLGLVCALFGLGGLLWSAGHDKGYPLVFVKTTIIGILLVMLGDNWLWSLLLLLPLGLYALQKLGLLNVPAAAARLVEKM